MRHEIAFLGLFLPSLVLCALIAIVLWFVVDYVMLRLSVWRAFWHPYLARLCLYFILFGIVARTYPDF